MAEPLKNLYNRSLITDLGSEISKRYTGFDQNAFKQAVFDKNWKNKELKQRMRHIAECLHQHLPADYIKAISILKPVSAEFSGFEYMFFSGLCGMFGLLHYPHLKATLHLF